MARILPIRQKSIPRLSQCYISHTDRNIQLKDMQQNSVKRLDRLKQCINHEAYNLSMAFLTIYSIFAIDIEKAGFGQPSAYIFGYIHVVAIIIFLIEMTLNSIGKQGYRCSFYFWIDLISTISMGMEITWVDNYLASNSNLPAILTIAKVVKASRLSRIGSRAAKIIFLFLEYFKNKKEQKEKMRLQNNNTQSVNGGSAQKSQSIIQSKYKDQTDNVVEEADRYHSQIVNQIPQKHQYERKGLQPIQEEKNSDKSSLEKGQLENKMVSLDQRNSLIKTKQTVLQPILGKIRSRIVNISQSVNTKKKSDKTKTFDISNIVQRMQQTFKLEPFERPNVDPLKKQQVQRQWREICQRELLENKQQKQKIKSDKQNFKLGQILKQRIQKNIIIMIMSLIIILPLISADVWFNKDPTIDQLMQNYMKLAHSLNNSAANSFLKDLIYTACNGSYPVLYIEFPTDDTILEYPGNLMPSLNHAPPLEDFMEVQIINASLDNYKLIFNSRNIDETNAVINIARSCFITILLIFSTIIFMHSIENKALVPLQNMCKSINKISINPFDALKEFNQKDYIDIEVASKNDLQTNKLERAIWKMTKIVALGAGETGSQLISTKIDSMSLNASYIDFEGSKIHGVFLYIQITDFQQNCKKHQQKLLTYINGITKNLHEIAMSNSGIILQSNPPYFLFYWKTPQDLHIQRETTKYYVAKNPLKNLGKTVQTQKIIQIVLRTYLKMSVSLIQSCSKKLQDVHYQQLYESFVIQAGIHLGDAYQGSVGNKYKIQVKFIGEDIDYVKRLSFLAEKYHLSNLLSYQVYDILDEPTQNNVRKIDYVKQRKQDDSFWLCTFDFSLFSLIQPKSFKKNKQSRKKRKNILRKTQKILKDSQDKNYVYKKRSEILEKINSEPIDTLVPYSRVQRYCTNSYDQPFYNNWNEAIQRYYTGEWDYASILFQNINLNLQSDYKDPISCLFIKRIERYSGEAPKQWQKTIVLEDLD